MQELRRLAVIMFSDIVGYTAMMQQNESLALVKLNRFKASLNHWVKEFRGEVIQYYGDGGLVIFTNSADAVNCASTLQVEFCDEPQVPVRIGIHSGDIIHNVGNIFGDSVNIASRIESMGIAGAVLISDSIQKQIKNKPQFKFTSLGNFKFKNVDEPMEILALAINNFPVPKRNEMDGKFKE